MFRFNPDHGSPENPSETSRPDNSRLRQLVEDSKLLPKMELIEMDLRESNTVSLEKAFNEALEKGEVHQFLDMCQSLAERLGAEESPVLENFLMAVVAGEVMGGELTDRDIQEVVKRVKEGDFK